MRTETETPIASRIRAAAKPTRFDAILARISPRLSSSRIRSRVDHELRMALAERAAARFSAHEAADHGRLRGDRWLASKLSSNDAISTELETMIDRALDLYRNDCFAASAINGRVDNVIGAGIRPQSRIQSKRGVITPGQAETLNAELERLWSIWARHQKFYDKQRQLERCNGIFGESWLHMADDDDRTKPVTLAIQVIHPQRIPLRSLRPGSNTQNRRLGLRLDVNGNPVAAFVTKQLPGDSHSYNLTETEVSLDDLLHCYEQTIPGQLRGIPWLSPAMGKLKDLKDFVHANLVAEQVAACHSAFVTGVTDPVLLAESARTASGSLPRSDLEDLAPGTINYLSEGEGITFSDPARPGSTLGPYVEWALHGVAASLRYPYELLAKQFTNNFSGGRLALIDGRVTFRIWQTCPIESQYRPLWSRFVDQCVYQGAVSVDLITYEQHRDHFLQHQWIPPGWPWVDPEKEVRADVQAIEAGLTTQTESLASRGRDFTETLQQIEREMREKADMEKRLKEYRETLGLSEQASGEGSADPFATIKSKFDAYGVGVRAGTISPQVTDEETARIELGLSPMLDTTRAAWGQENNIRRPITLAPPPGQRPAPVGGSIPASPEPIDDEPSDELEPATQQEQ